MLKHVRTGDHIYKEYKIILSQHVWQSKKFDADIIYKVFYKHRESRRRKPDEIIA